MSDENVIPLRDRLRAKRMRGGACACGQHLMNSPDSFVELDERGVKHGWDKCPPDEPWRSGGGA